MDHSLLVSLLRYTEELPARRDFFELNFIAHKSSSGNKPQTAKYTPDRKG